MALDYLASITSDSARILAALAAEPNAPISWCGDWTVKDCAHHVAAVHHVVAQVVTGRPATDFGIFATLDAPEASDPALAQWLSAGTSALVEALEATDPSAEVWSWWPEGRNAAFWRRRMAQETSVHRWDAEHGAGVEAAPTDPALAADAVDEFLDVFLAVTRQMNRAPGNGETAHLHCTDVEGEWLVRFLPDGARELRREHSKGDVAFRGPAGELMLFVWGRAGDIETIGDDNVARRWRELAPAM